MAPQGSVVTPARGAGLRIDTPNGGQIRLMDPTKSYPNGYGRILDPKTRRYTDQYGNIVDKCDPAGHIQPGSK